MIGPSAPNGPPVPMATGRRKRLEKCQTSRHAAFVQRTLSIASGIQLQRMPGEPNRAIRPTITLPIAGTISTNSPM